MEKYNYSFLPNDFWLQTWVPVDLKVLCQVIFARRLLCFPSCSWLPNSAMGSQSTPRSPYKPFSSSYVGCKVEMGWLICNPVTTGLITGKITTNLKLKKLDLLLKFRSVTSVQVVLYCCSTLGLEGSRVVETAEKIGTFFLLSQACIKFGVFKTSI